MNKMIEFNNAEFDNVRVVKIENDVWMLGKDIVKNLGYDITTNSYSKYIKTFCDGDDYMVLNKSKLDLLGFTDAGRKGEYLINESGLYSLVLSSKLESAKRFKKWVTSEVLPTIRRTGGYINNSDLMVETYFGGCDETSKTLVRGLLQNIESQQKQITQLTTEVMHKEDVIIGLVDDIDLATKRQRITQIVRHGSKKYQERYSLLYTEFEKRYHMSLDRRLESAPIKAIKPKIKNKMDLIDRGLNMIPQLYEIACKVFENDVENLKQEWDYVVTRN